MTYALDGHVGTISIEGRKSGNTLDEVQSFKYLGAIISEESSKIDQVKSALSRLKTVRRYCNITLRSKTRISRVSRDIDLPVYMPNLDTHRRHNTRIGDEMLPNTPQYVVYISRQK